VSTGTYQVYCLFVVSFPPFCVLQLRFSNPRTSNSMTRPQALRRAQKFSRAAQPLVLRSTCSPLAPVVVHLHPPIPHSVLLPVLHASLGQRASNISWDLFVCLWLCSRCGTPSGFSSAPDFFLFRVFFFHQVLNRLESGCRGTLKSNRLSRRKKHSVKTVKTANVNL
jgi:hypothetical protein